MFVFRLKCTVKIECARKSSARDTTADIQTSKLPLTQVRQVTNLSWNQSRQQVLEKIQFPFVAKDEQAER